jgi:hypothetical protein
MNIREAHEKFATDEQCLDEQCLADAGRLMTT